MSGSHSRAKMSPTMTKSPDFHLFAIVYGRRGEMLIYLKNLDDSAAARARSRFASSLAVAASGICGASSQFLPFWWLAAGAGCRIRVGSPFPNTWEVLAGWRRAAASIAEDRPHGHTRHLPRIKTFLAVSSPSAVFVFAANITIVIHVPADPRTFGV